MRGVVEFIYGLSYHLVGVVALADDVYTLLQCVNALTREGVYLYVAAMQQLIYLYVVNGSRGRHTYQREIVKEDLCLLVYFDADI